MGGILFWLLLVLGVLVGLVALIAIVGCFLPKGHVVARSLKTSQPAEAVWQIITDFVAAPTWNANIKQVERMPDRNGHAVWREHYKGGPPMQLETLEAIPPRRLVRLIADEKGPFTGRWEFELTLEGSGCRVTITEHGEIANPLIRCIFRSLMNPAMFLEMYLKALAAKLGEPAQLEQPAISF